MNATRTYICFACCYVALAAVGYVSIMAAESEQMPKEVSWLAEVVEPPGVVTSDPPEKLSLLLVNAEDISLDTLAQWEMRRKELLAAWHKLLGPMPSPRPAVQFKVLRTDQLKGLTRQLVQYESEPGLLVEGYLLRPTDMKQEEKRAAVVALHATTGDTIDRIAGLTGDPTRQIGLQLAQRGFVVFCPRCFLWQNVDSLPEAVDQFRKRHPRTLGMHKMLYDAQRGLDLLETLPYVDANRLGAVGHSLGAKEVLYLTAFDPRVKAAVASEGGLHLKSTNWEAPWYLGEVVKQPTFERNHHELLALIAPRPLLILAGENGPGAADGDRNWPLLTAAQPVYGLYERPVRLGMYNHGMGHAIPAKAFERMAQWLEAYLPGP